MHPWQRVLPTPIHVYIVRSGRLRLRGGGYFVRPINRPSSIAAINNANNEITSLTLIPIPF